MNLVKKILMVFVLSLSLSGSAVLVWAQDNQAPNNVDLWGDALTEQGYGARLLNSIGLGKNDPRLIIVRLIQIALGLLGLLAVVLIMYGGYVWMTANGDPAKVEQARNILKNATIGLLIILAVLALVTYIINRLLYATGTSGTGGTGQSASGGIGALGAGIIVNVYPEPGQKDVPRNTKILVTFREAIKPAGVCDTVTNPPNGEAGSLCAPGAKILPTSIKIYQSAVGSGEQNALAYAASQDNKTFVFTPTELLGSASAIINYSVELTDDLEKLSGGKAFNFGGFVWSFEVSNKLDLTPPQVLSAGVFPGPDNGRDTPGPTKAAVQARGAVEFLAAPQAFRPYAVGARKTNPDSVDLTVNNPQDNNCDGRAQLSVNALQPPTASALYLVTGFEETPVILNINNNQVNLACGFTVELADNFAVGHSWELTLQTTKQADWLIVDRTRYNFVDKVPGANEVELSNDFEVLAGRLSATLQTNGAVTAQSSGAKVNLTAAIAGKNGNNISLAASNAAAIVITPLANGQDQQLTWLVQDLPDKPKNAVVQINFSESINPLYLSGTSERLKDWLRTLNLSDNKAMVPGSFTVSNQYRTVEFMPDFQCGVNGCGEKIYCLPSNSQLTVELVAAKLASSCSKDSDCQTQAPYTACRNGFCYDPVSASFNPKAAPDSGLADLADNSLDGNRDNQATGPQSFYNQNQPKATDGDSFTWSFWINDQLDLQPPVISQTNLRPLQTGVAPDSLVEVNFNKLLLSDSLRSGLIVVDNGRGKITHQLVNLWSVGKRPLGYWVTKSNVETSSPPDNEPDATLALIKHTPFTDANKYRAQFGSGVKDIYQNCYKPSSSLSCQGGPSCCNEEATDSERCQ